MNTKPKQKRQDEARQPAQTPLADAIVLGTAAGGLVLGTMQAQGATHEAKDDFQAVRAVDPIDHQSSAVAHDEPSPSSPATLAVDEPATIIPNVVQPIAVAAFDPATSENSIPAPIEEKLVYELSQEIAGTISKVIQGAEPGMSAADFSQSISADIVQSAQDIVARLDIGALLTESRGLGDSILSQLDPAGMAEGILDGTANLAETILADVGTLPAEILGGTVGALADLPSALLGNDGPEGSGGLLSELFYADGGSDSLSIPDLSAAASSMVADIGNAAGGLLGLSYTDVADHQGGHGLNALSLL